ncbi:unnamed protein product [Soboliphyme baturini]|uniref:BAR domain-containing protein n=1 Tax=Soboliphyme baturini TaxID=241478 RepID=A0A183J1Q3_9BILA|nr:unnamed protein product [Soboliphyme baturini]
MPLFGKSTKNPADIVKGLKEATLALERGDKKSEKLQEDAARHLQAMKTVLYGSNDSEPQTELIAQLAQETYTTGLIPLLINNFTKFDFEATLLAVCVTCHLLIYFSVPPLCSFSAVVLM